MPKKRSLRRKDTKKKRKLAPAKAAKRDRTPAYTNQRKIQGKPRPPISGAPMELQENGSGSETAGQPLDMKRIAIMERANSETVEQLAEEGQPLEAEVLAGVEEAEGSDETEVTTHEVLADDVPSEYDSEP